MEQTFGIHWLELFRRSVLGVIFSGTAYMMASVPLQETPITLDGSTLGLLIVALGFGAVGVALLFNVVSVIWQNPRVQLRDDGVTIATRSHALDWAWDEFYQWSNSIMLFRINGISSFIIGEGKFLSKEKPALIIRPVIKNAHQISEAIRLRVTEAVYYRYVEAYQRGETLDFGMVTLSKAGLRLDTTLIPFDDLDNVTMHNSELVIYRRSQAIPTRWKVNSKLRTPELLLAVIKTVLAERAAPTPNNQEQAGDI